MTKTLAAWVMTSCVVVFAAAPASANEKDRHVLAVRAYNTRLGATAMNTALSVIRATFGRVRIPIAWQECSPDLGRSTAVCDQPPAEDEIVVRILPGGGTVSLPTVLGMSLVGAPPAPGLVTIWADRVETRARSADVDAGVLLGRAIAHEIGHVLLGTSTHAAWGLMRAEWTDHELIVNAPFDWAFAPAEAGRLRQGFDLRRHPPVENAAEATRDPSVSRSSGDL